MEQYQQNLALFKQASIEDSVIKTNLIEIIDNEVSRLPRLIRDVFILRHYQNLKWEEISEILKISISRARRLMEKSGIMLLKQLEKLKIDKSILN